jgi:hypothetical protein
MSKKKKSAVHLSKKKPPFTKPEAPPPKTDTPPEPPADPVAERTKWQKFKDGFGGNSGGK